MYNDSFTTGEVNPLHFSMSMIQYMYSSTFFFVFDFAQGKCKGSRICRIEYKAFKVARR